MVCLLSSSCNSHGGSLHAPTVQANLVISDIANGDNCYSHEAKYDKV